MPIWHMAVSPGTARPPLRFGARSAWGFWDISSSSYFWHGFAPLLRGLAGFVLALGTRGVDCQGGVDESDASGSIPAFGADLIGDGAMRF